MNRKEDFRSRGVEADPVSGGKIQQVCKLQGAHPCEGTGGH